MFPAAVLLGIERVGMMPKSFLFLTSLQMALFYLKLSAAVPLGTAFYP